MRFEFDVQMDEKTLYDFVMYHNYMAGSGFIWVLLGIFAIILAIISDGTTSMTYRLLYLILGLLFVVYIPWDLKRKAKKQLATNPFYAKPIHYVVDEDGIHSAQDEQEATVVWKDFRRLKLSKKSVIIYMKNRSACVFPREVFGNDLEKAVEWMKSKVAR